LTGTLFLSKTIALANQFVMETDRYRIEVPWSQRLRIKLQARTLPGVDMELQPSSAADQDCFQLQLEEFARIKLQGGNPTVTGEAAALSVKLCEEFYAQRVQLEEPWTRYPAAPVHNP